MNIDEIPEFNNTRYWLNKVLRAIDHDDLRLEKGCWREVIAAFDTWPLEVQEQMLDIFIDKASLSGYVDLAIKTAGKRKALLAAVDRLAPTCDSLSDVADAIGRFSNA